MKKLLLLTTLALVTVTATGCGWCGWQHSAWRPFSRPFSRDRGGCCGTSSAHSPAYISGETYSSGEIVPGPMPGS